MSGRLLGHWRLFQARIRCLLGARRLWVVARRLLVGLVVAFVGLGGGASMANASPSFSTAYDAPVSAYDSAAHSVQAHTSEDQSLTAARVLEGVCGTATNAAKSPTVSSLVAVAADSGSNIVYRGLAAGEDPAAGLTARAPGASGVSPVSHVAGKVQSPWISTSGSFEVASGKYGANGVVGIDLSRVGTQVVDLRGGFPGGGMLSNWAVADQEVLIYGSVPPEAIVGVWP